MRLVTVNNPPPLATVSRTVSRGRLHYLDRGGCDIRARWIQYRSRNLPCLGLAEQICSAQGKRQQKR